MTFQGKSLGLLVSVPPGEPGFAQALGLARKALERGLQVYWYGLDEGVRGIESHELRQLVERGLRLFACAYGAERRQLPHHDHAVYSGLGMVNDLMTRTDRFLSFN